MHLFVLNVLTQQTYCVVSHIVNNHYQITSPLQMHLLGQDNLVFNCF